MKIAITDACIFIDLHDLQLTTQFFGLEMEVHTSFDVLNELYPEQQEIFKDFQAAGKLTVHTITGELKNAIQEAGYPKSLSESDKTVLYLAEKMDAMVLSSDRAVRHIAKVRAIEYHGMLWIFDRLVEVSLTGKAEASLKLQTLIMTNVIYRNNAALAEEMKKRLRMWENE